MGYRQYTEEEKAVALAFLKQFRGNYQKAARKTGIPWTTIQAWDKGVGVNTATNENSLHKKGELAALWEEEAQAALAEAAKKRVDASYYQLIAAAGIATDKVNNLREKDALTDEDLARFASALESAVADADEETQARITDALRILFSGDSGSDSEQQSDRDSEQATGD